MAPTLHRPIMSAPLEIVSAVRCPDPRGTMCYIDVDADEGGDSASWCVLFKTREELVKFASVLSNSWKELFFVCHTHLCYCLVVEGLLCICVLWPGGAMRVSFLAIKIPPSICGIPYEGIYVV